MNDDRYVVIQGSDGRVYQRDWSSTPIDVRTKTLYHNAHAKVKAERDAAVRLLALVALPAEPFLAVLDAIAEFAAD